MIILKFIHNGHQDKVNEFSWHKSKANLIASVDNSNQAHIWQMTKSINEMSEYDLMLKKEIFKDE